MDLQTYEKLSDWADKNRGKTFRDGGVTAALVAMFDNIHTYRSHRTEREVALQHKLDLVTQEVEHLKRLNAVLERTIDMVGAQKPVVAPGGAMPQQTRFVWKVLYRGVVYGSFDSDTEEDAERRLRTWASSLRNRDVPIDELKADGYQIVRHAIVSNVWGPGDVPPGCYT